jgi:hypothetical protein
MAAISRTILKNKDFLQAAQVFCSSGTAPVSSMAAIFPACTCPK